MNTIATCYLNNPQQPGASIYRTAKPASSILMTTVIQHQYTVSSLQLQEEKKRTQQQEIKKRSVFYTMGIFMCQPDWALGCPDI